jgi:hypothetical protein
MTGTATGSKSRTSIESKPEGLKGGAEQVKAASMAQESGLAQRGLLLLGLMLAIVTVVGFILFRPTSSLPPEDNRHPELAALAVPGLGACFPANINWGATAVLGERLPSSPGWGTRYNATVSLASQGSTKTPFDVLAQMLDEDQQMRNFRVRLGDGKEIANEYKARRTVLLGLKAFADWHKHKEAVRAVGDSPELQRVYAAIDKLTTSTNDVVRKEAESVKKTTSPR